MNQRLITPLVLCGLFILPASVLAQTKAKEKRQDRRELRTDRREHGDARLDRGARSVERWVTR